MNRKSIAYLSLGVIRIAYIHVIVVYCVGWKCVLNGVVVDGKKVLDTVISLYARVMSVREIQGHLKELYHTEVFPVLISAVTDEVAEDVRQWQGRSISHSLSGLHSCKSAGLRHGWRGGLAPFCWFIKVNIF